LVDLRHVMTQAVRYLDMTGRRFDRSGRETDPGSAGTVQVTRSQGAAVKDDMLEARMEHVNGIRERIARDEYRVDAQAVAEAIVRRLLADARPQDSDAS
jgi:anti-sigma28 factor (negative regulator of flagellin synthesis)